MSIEPEARRILSGMRPTGRLHLGHYHGVLKNWVRLQEEAECFFFVADWHALTTHYEEPTSMNAHVWDMLVDWLASGIDPDQATLFIQSRVPQHAELHLLLSMITPLGWLLRVPSFKDQQQQLKDRDLATYGFLGYPLLQSADILMYRATGVPVGEDQVPHVELTREIARRFNYVFGRDSAFEEKAQEALPRLGKKVAKAFSRARNEWLQEGSVEARERALGSITGSANISAEDRERLSGFLDGGGRVILPEPEALLTPAAKMPGLDGQKMSKSYNNTIQMRDEPERVSSRLMSMPTDPARQRRNDPGDPEKCPVWDLHRVYTSEEKRNELSEGCKSAAIGCVDCKKPLLESLLEEQALLRARAEPFERNPGRMREVIEVGCARAREVAEETLEEVRTAVGTLYT
jgi:tryptophanyl-tRNA synthetase